MTAKQTTPRTAAQAGRAFYADPAMRLAAEAMRHGYPMPTTVPAGTAPGARISRQHRAAVAGRPVRPLPTRAMRTAKRRTRRAQQRATKALAVLGVTLLILIFLIPTVAAVTAASTLAAMTLAWSK